MNEASDPRSMAGSVVRLFEQAESRIKELELLYGDGLACHPINQLRYAGYHITKAIAETNPTGNAEQWKRATRHCQRAIYDASEMAIVYCLNEFKNFGDDYRTVDFSPTIPDYLDIVEKIEKAQNLLATTNHDTRYQKYKECDRLFTDIKPLIDRLNRSRLELNKRLRRNRINMLLVGATILLAIVGLIAKHW
ncbi:hypothetical protein BMS3Abin12_00609 [bacterium BMS3Abin12]|nr:hypothetical protein BMS3Abin12_00609 [bacterium BMS3Abin12]